MRKREGKLKNESREKTKGKYWGRWAKLKQTNWKEKGETKLGDGRTAPRKNATNSEKGGVTDECTGKGEK